MDLDFEQEFKDYVFMITKNNKRHYDFLKTTIQEYGNSYEAEKRIKGYILSKPALVKDIAAFALGSFSYKEQMEDL